MTVGMSKWIVGVLLITYIRGVIIDPALPNAENRKIVMCLNADKTLQLKYPFVKAPAADPRFLLYRWLRKDNESDVGDDLYMIDKDGKVVIIAKGLTSFDEWGLEINPVQVKDSGIYEAIYITSAVQLKRKVHVVVAKPPVLSSEKLMVESKKTGNTRVVTCGNVADLGVPPVRLVLKSGDGTILNSTYENGFLKLQLAPETEAGEFYCGIEDPSPAKACIPAFDLMRWDSSLQFGRSTSSADMTSIIIGVVVVVMFILIGVLIFIIKKRCRNQRNNTYNTTTEEARLAKEQLSLDNFDPGSEEDLGTPPRLASKASSASPYMVTGLMLTSNHYATSPANRPQQQQKEQLIDKAAPVATADDDDRDIGPPTKPRIQKRHGWGGGDPKTDQPPVPKKRNNHFTVSNEGLNLVEKPPTTESVV